MATVSGARQTLGGGFDDAITFGVRQQALEHHHARLAQAEHDLDLAVAGVDLAGAAHQVGLSGRPGCSRLTTTVARHDGSRRAASMRASALTATVASQPLPTMAPRMASEGGRRATAR